MKITDKNLEELNTLLKKRGISFSDEELVEQSHKLLYLTNIIIKQHTDDSNQHNKG